jgi:hypothetical protein
MTPDDARAKAHELQGWDCAVDYVPPGAHRGQCDRITAYIQTTESENAALRARVAEARSEALREAAEIARRETSCGRSLCLHETCMAGREIADYIEELAASTGTPKTEGGK